MLNTTIYVPYPVVIDTSGGDHEFPKNATLRGIDVFTAGDLDFTGDNGVRLTVTFPSAANGGAYPCRYPMQIRTIHDAGTTIADSALVGLQ